MSQSPSRSGGKISGGHTSAEKAPSSRQTKLPSLRLLGLLLLLHLESSIPPVHGLGTTVDSDGLPSAAAQRVLLQMAQPNVTTAALEEQIYQVLVYRTIPS